MKQKAFFIIFKGVSLKQIKGIFLEGGSPALRVFDPNACRYRNKSLQQCHFMNEQEKKRAYNEKILQIEHGTFTPLVFSINGSMGRECQKF